MSLLPQEGCEICFYCGAHLPEGCIEWDHFPWPARARGAVVVPACRTCHDMKDRVLLGDLPVSFLASVLADFSKWGREARILFAKACALGAELQQQKDGIAPPPIPERVKERSSAVRCEDMAQLREQMGLPLPDAPD